MLHDALTASDVRIGLHASHCTRITDFVSTNTANMRHCHAPACYAHRMIRSALLGHRLVAGTRSGKLIWIEGPRWQTVLPNGAVVRVDTEPASAVAQIGDEMIRLNRLDSALLRYMLRRHARIAL